MIIIDYYLIKVGEFEMAWEGMIQRSGITNDEWLQTCFEDREREREREAPVYFKDTYFSGMSTLLKDESTQLFNGYTLKDYFFQIIVEIILTFG